MATKLHAQGFHWGEFFARWPLMELTPKGRWNFMGHVVNNAMAPKAHALWWRQTADEREWCDTTEIALDLPMRPSLRFGYSGAIAIERGPLVFSLKIGEDWRRVHADQPYRELPHANWEVYPTTPWM